MACFYFGNIPVEISVYVTCEVMGKGAGSIADMNFTQGIGAIVCPGLSVKSSRANRFIFTIPMLLLVTFYSLVVGSPDRLRPTT